MTFRLFRYFTGPLYGTNTHLRTSGMDSRDARGVSLVFTSPKYLCFMKHLALCAMRGIRLGSPARNGDALSSCPCPLRGDGVRIAHGTESNNLRSICQDCPSSCTTSKDESRQFSRFYLNHSLASLNGNPMPSFYLLWNSDTLNIVCPATNIVLSIVPDDPCANDRSRDWVSSLLS